MDAARYEKAGRVFHAAADLPRDRRAAVVAEMCASDEELRRDVESLLAAHDEAGRFIDTPAIEIAAALIAADDTARPGPSRIGHYEVTRLIARGGMGDVYEAIDPTLGRRVALKLPRDAPTAHAIDLGRFEHEARAASSLNHPNIVTIYEIGQIGDRRFIAMELVDGQSLADVDGRPLELAPLVRIGRQLAQAMSVAHAAGIVHGDIKPENVMLRADGYVKVLDFGVARLLLPAPGDSDGREHGPRFGTPKYMSPEQARGAAASTSSDVFALGVVLYELATGRRPFEGNGDAAQPGLLDGNAAARASIDSPGLPAPIERIVRRMLDTDAAARPTAAEVEAALASIELASAKLRRHGTHGLPAQRTPFVGRAAELLALETMLLDTTTRLVTLTGTAGTGKTRLALQVAAQTEPHFEGGVWFVNLAPITDPGLVAAAVAQAHGVREIVGRPLVEVLCEQLRERGRTLVLMDNFEQVAPAASMVRELLDSCPELTVLVTSRLVLHVYGEREFSVPPLPVPDARDAPERLLECASVQLFVQRAAAVKPDFSLTERNAEPVVEICRRLDGLPLAIELAAARAKILQPSELLARLERRLDLLGEAAHDRPARQKTLRQAIDWSYYLLSPQEQALFRRLSVFVSGCSLEAIEAVCNSTEDLGTDVMGGVFTLVDNSLLIPRTTGEEPSRFFMLETVREYARERLEESEETSATQRAHAAYVLVVAEEETPELTAPEREAWLAWCDREHDNIRAAIQYLVAVRDAEWGVRLGAALLRFWEQREHLTEGREAFAALLAIPHGGPPTRARARALYHSGMLADAQGDHDAALSRSREAFAIFEQLGDRRGVASTLQTLAWQAQLRGSYREARELLKQAAALWHDLGDAAAADMARSNMATVAKAQGDEELARTLCEELLSSAARRSDHRAMASLLNQLGDLAAGRGDGPLARRYHHESLAIFRRIDDRWGVARVLTDLAAVEANEGHDAGAEASLIEALQITRALGHQRGVARRLELLAACAGRQARYAAAVTLASAAALTRRKVGVPADLVDRQKLDETLADAVHALGRDAYNRAWIEGQSQTLDEVLGTSAPPTA